jgi:hypothetical protein
VISSDPWALLPNISYLLLWVPLDVTLAGLTKLKRRIADTRGRALEFPDLTVR